jgi:hypothetical protein
MPFSFLERLSFYNRLKVIGFVPAVGNVTLSALCGRILEARLRKVVSHRDIGRQDNRDPIPFHLFSSIIVIYKPLTKVIYPFIPFMKISVIQFPLMNPLIYNHFLKDILAGAYLGRVILMVNP